MWKIDEKSRDQPFMEPKGKGYVGVVEEIKQILGLVLLEDLVEKMDEELDNRKLLIEDPIVIIFVLSCYDPEKPKSFDLLSAADQEEEANYDIQALTVAESGHVD